MLDYLTTLFDFLYATLWFYPERLQIVAHYDHPIWLTIGVVTVAALSTLVGESIVLFINRVTPTRFLISFLLNGLLFGLDIIIAAIFTWLVGELLFPTSPTLLRMLFLVSLNTAPFVFGVFILIPYAGTLVGRVLQVWRFLLMLGAVQTHFEVSLTPALIAITIGWLFMLTANHLIGRPSVRIRKQLWQKLLGVPVHQPLDPFITRFRRMVKRYTLRRQKE